MMATVPHVTSGSGLRKFQADGFLFDRVYSRTAIKCDNTANHNMQHGFTTGDQYSRGCMLWFMCAFRQ